MKKTILMLLLCITAMVKAVPGCGDPLCTPCYDSITVQTMVDCAALTGRGWFCGVDMVTKFAARVLCFPVCWPCIIANEPFCCPRRPNSNTYWCDETHAFKTKEEEQLPGALASGTGGMTISIGQPPAVAPKPGETQA